MCPLLLLSLLLAFVFSNEQDPGWAKDLGVGGGNLPAAPPSKPWVTSFLSVVTSTESAWKVKLLDGGWKRTLARTFGSSEIRPFPLPVSQADFRVVQGLRSKMQTVIALNHCSFCMCKSPLKGGFGWRPEERRHEALAGARFDFPPLKMRREWSQCAPWSGGWQLSGTWPPPRNCWSLCVHSPLPWRRNVSVGFLAQKLRRWSCLHVCFHLIFHKKTTSSA